MLETVTIQNFKSLRDITVTLQKVNLLIGPNNSGKSNFLKALAFLKEHYNQRIFPGNVDFSRLFYKHKYNSYVTGPNNSIAFCFQWKSQSHDQVNSFYQLELLGFNGSNLLTYIEGVGFREGLINNKVKLTDIEFIKNNFGSANILFENNTFYLSKSLRKQDIKNETGVDVESSLQINIYDNQVSFSNYKRSLGAFLHDNEYDFVEGFSITNLFNSIKIFRPDPTRMTAENELFTHNHVNEDCSNLVAFLDNMRDGYDHIWQAIQNDLTKCLPDFVGISFDKVPIKGKEKSLGKRFGLRDKAGKTYWAEELSEGTIYFLALLAIVHQPDPPKVLLLEEPEKGIHPRRIAEVMDLVFKLAEEKDIQIIMTSHSTQVVDAFQDIPESVFVFDMEDGETKIRNLQTDILEQDAKDAKEKGFPPIDYSKRSLSEHWAIGLLGGVPH